MARRKLGFWRRLAVVVVKPVVVIWTRRTWRGVDHIPATGGVIIVANHLSQADPVVSAHFIYDAGRWPRYLGKASLFRLPVIGWLLHKCRQVPVERGSVDAARALEAATEAIRAGGAVVIYPEGTITRDPELWPMRGKTGAARLALATGAPVIPLAIWGPQRMFDPRDGKLRVRPNIPVTVVAGPPVDLDRWVGSTPSKPVLDEMTEEIMARLRDMLVEIRGEAPAPRPPLRSSGGRPAGQAPGGAA